MKRFGTEEDRNGLNEPPDDERGGREPDLDRQLVRDVSRSLPWVVSLVLLGALAGLGVGVVQSNSYASNAKLLLRVGAREQMTSESLVDLGQQRTPPPNMSDELQMLSDVAIFERVARDLGPEVVLRPADPARDDGPGTPVLVRVMHRIQAYWSARMAGGGEPSDEDYDDSVRAATKVLVENTVVANEPGSNVIHVSHTSSTPEQARDVVGALSDAFIVRHREQFSIQALLDKGRIKLEQAKRARDEAASAFVAHLGQSGIAQLEAQVPRLELALAAIESELFAARVRREEIARLKASLSDRLQGIPSEIEVRFPAVMVPNEEYETQLALKRKLLEQKQELLVESRPSEETRRRERELDKQIAKVEDKLEQTPKTIAQGTEMQQNLGHSEMETRIADLEVEDEALVVKGGLLEARLAEKQSEMAVLRAQVLVATTLRNDLAAARDVEQSRYVHLLERFSALEALDSIDLDEDVNLRLLQAPTLEEDKVGPERISLLLKGSMAGVFAGLAFAVLRRRFDRKLRYPETLERERGVPVLGIVPYQRSLQRASRAAKASGS